MKHARKNLSKSSSHRHRSLSENIQPLFSSSCENVLQSVTLVCQTILITLKCLWSKKSLPLIWKVFQSKEEWRLPFWNTFFRYRDISFLCYANEESDDVIDGSTKTVPHSINNISRNNRAVFFKLGTRSQHHKRRKMYITKGREWHLLSCCHGNTLGLSLFPWKTKYPRDGNGPFPTL